MGRGSRKGPRNQSTRSRVDKMIRKKRERSSNCRGGGKEQK